ncbi:hypothetical protein [Bacillus phage vB_BanS-Thrax1]|nr:hypothetical protein [Bacillus phage vB_BanS-Thrax1]
MEFEKAGNLGKLDLLHRHLYLKQMRSEDNSVALSEEEVNEVIQQLGAFRHLLSNMFLYQNSLENDKYGALVSILKEFEPYYRNYEGESK